MPDGTEKGFFQIQNNLNNRKKVLEFDKQSERMLQKQKDEVAALPDKTPGLEITLMGKDFQIVWLMRGMEKARMLIKREGLSEEEIALLDSPLDGEFWAAQDLVGIEAFFTSF